MDHDRIVAAACHYAKLQGEIFGARESGKLDDPTLWGSRLIHAADCAMLDLRLAVLGDNPDDMCQDIKAGIEHGQQVMRLCAAQDTLSGKDSSTEPRATRAFKPGARRAEAGLFAFVIAQIERRVADKRRIAKSDPVPAPTAPKALGKHDEMPFEVREIMSAKELEALLDLPLFPKKPE